MYYRFEEITKDLYKVYHDHSDMADDIANIPEGARVGFYAPIVLVDQNNEYASTIRLYRKKNGKLVSDHSSVTKYSRKRLIDADKLISKITEKSKLPSLSADTINGLCGAISIIYDMLNETEEESDNNE